MTRHHGKALVFAVSALIGLIAGEARAASIVMTITTNGSTITVAGGQIVSSDAQNLQVNTGAVNTTLAGLGSAYEFTGSLGASSNWAGASNAFLTENGTLVVPVGASGALGPITIAVTETGFTSPTGPSGTLTEGSSAIYTNTAKGDNQSATGTYNSAPSVTLPPSTMTSTGPGINNYSPMSSTPISTFVTPFGLTQSVTINLSQTGLRGTDVFGSSVQVTTVPEPASIVMMLTGMPLPLVVLGLLHRRRATRG